MLESGYSPQRMSAMVCSRIRLALTSIRREIAVAMMIVITLLPGPTDGDKPGGPHEYCQDSTFDGRCAADETILMTSAQYGRKLQWDCVISTLGLADCTRNALGLMDAMCSGHRECQMKIMNPEIRKLKPCTPDVTWHLLASYDCIKVNTRPTVDCQKYGRLQVNEPSGFLSSEVAMTTGLGSAHCPWDIAAPEGQTINITLYNFAHNAQSGSSQSTSVGASVATIRDTTGNKPIGSPTHRIQAYNNRQRIIPTYVSRGNRIQVTFTEGAGNEAAVKNRTQFLLKYEFVGCADLPSPDGAEVVRNGPKVEVKCAASGETWYLTCDGNQWNGKLGNCTRPLPKKSWTDEMFQNDDNFPFGILVVVAVGVALGIFLGGTLLLVVSIYMKRRHTRSDPRTMQYETEAHTFHGAPMPEDFYTKQELTELDHKDDTLHTHARMTAEEYKITEYRSPYPNQMSYSTGTHSGPRNMHHVYESPKFT